MMTVSTLALHRLNKFYSNGLHAVCDLDLEVDDGEFLVLVGPSGCGKTTALRMIAGIETISSGELRIEGRLANDLPPRERDLAMVFQDFALYPHMTAFENIAFPLARAQMHRRDVAVRVEDVARLLDISDLLDRKPSRLSGGQRQRVAMARAIVRHPTAFLMDEPLSNLDAQLRVQMRTQIARLHARLGVTTVYVTHDQAEAMTLGSRVAVMRGGDVVQLDSPQRLYDRPDDVFVAAFVGSPTMNLYLATMSGDRIVLGTQSLRLPESIATSRPGLRAYDGRQVVVGIRPDHFDAAAVGGAAAGRPTLRAEVAFVEGLGNELIVHFTLDTPSYIVADADPVPQWYGRPLSVGRFDTRSDLNIYAPLDVAVDVDQLHFFDPRTERAIWS